MLDTNWRDAPVDDITGHIVLRSHRRYGLTTPNDDVTTAWSLLVESAYAQDLSVQDGTGVPHLGSNEAWSWEADLHTPTPTMCNIWTAWSKLISAASAVPDPTIEPFRYDLVNTGRTYARIACTESPATYTPHRRRSTGPDCWPRREEFHCRFGRDGCCANQCHRTVLRPSPE